MSVNQPLHYLTLHELASMIAEREVSCVEVTEHMLARIQALEPTLHGYYAVLSDQVRITAKQRDEQIAQGRTLGPLHGVPIALKDLCHVRGTPTTGGHHFRQGLISEKDATVALRLHAAGAVLLGKVATTEGAMVGYHPSFDVPRNPWDQDRWPGVSSGGSGVATAAGLCFASLGSDTGGSIRYPSAANGLVGLKPTWGRVSRHNVMDLAPTLDHVGPMTRSVRDAARVLTVIAGHDPEDETSLIAPVDDYEAALEQGAEGLRIGWDEDYATSNVESYVVDALFSALKQLKKAGASIVDVRVPQVTVDETAAWSVIAGTEAAVAHEATYPSQHDNYGAYFREFLASAQSISGIDVSRAVVARKEAGSRMATVFKKIDCLLCPTLASESFQYRPEAAYEGFNPIERTIAGVPPAFFARNGRFITIWDYNGYPTLSVPCGFSPMGMPLSLQLIAKPLDESLLLRAGYAYESANTHCDQHPDL